MAAWTITKVQTQQAFNAQGQLAPFTVVAYTIGDHGPFEARFPGAALDAAAMKQYLDQQVAALQSLGAVKP